MLRSPNNLTVGFQNATCPTRISASLELERTQECYVTMKLAEKRRTEKTKKTKREGSVLRIANYRQATRNILNGDGQSQQKTANLVFNFVFRNS